MRQQHVSTLLRRTVRLRHTLYIIGVALLAVSCGEGKHEPTTDELAARAAGEAAQRCYDRLLARQVEAYVDSIDGTRHATADYRQLLADHTRRFLQRQDSLHQGIRTAAVDSTSFSAKDSTARVFLRLTYGDGGTERVLLPMLCRQGRWWMR